MAQKALRTLQSNIKQDFTDWAWEHMQRNKKYRQNLPTENKTAVTYCEGYEQALVDLTNFILGYDAIEGSKK